MRMFLQTPLQIPLRMSLQMPRRWTGRALMWAAVGLWSGSVSVSHTLAAQTLPTLSAKDSAAAIAAWAEADTGRMTPGYRDLSRYNTPGYCAAAVRGVLDETWRRNEREIVESASSADTLPTVAIAAGKACAAHLPSVSEIPAVELPPLIPLAVAIQDTVLLDRAIARLQSLATTDEARGWVLYDALEQVVNPYTGPSALRMPLVTALVARLDAMGAGAHIPKLRAHGLLRHIAEGVRFDPTTMIREDRIARDLIPLLTADEKQEVYNQIPLGFSDSLYVWWTRHPPHLADSVRGIPTRDGAFFAARAIPIGQHVPEFMEMAAQTFAKRIGTPAPQITGNFWFSQDSSHVKPTLGKVTLVVRASKGDGLMSGTMAMFKRLYDRYHEQGLDIVLVLRTQGYSWSSPPQSPADEAKTIAWYYRDYLKLPFTVVVEETPFTRQPDGRRVDGRTPFDSLYMGRTTIVGRDGTIFTNSVGTESESQYETFISMALAEGTSASQH